MDKNVVTIIFPDGIVKYEYKTWQVRIEGYVYPRQLKAAAEMIQVYKECSREDHWND